MVSQENTLKVHLKPSKFTSSRETRTICCITEEILCTVEDFWGKNVLIQSLFSLFLCLLDAPSTSWYIKISTLLCHRLIELFYHLLVPNRLVHKANISTFLSIIYFCHQAGLSIQTRWHTRVSCGQRWLTRCFITFLKIGSYNTVCVCARVRACYWPVALLPQTPHLCLQLLCVMSLVVP